MTPDIRFPNLGINIDNLIKEIKIYNNFSIAIYGIMITIGILAGLYIAQRNAKVSGQDPEFYTSFVVVAVISSLIGARLYYVIFSWDEFKDNILKIFNLRSGGLAIYGAVIFAVITAYVYGKYKNKSFLEICDTACPGLILGQAIGRWGNFFNREAFGGYTDSFFAMQIRASDITQGNLNSDANTKLVEYMGEKYLQVHPTFLYESIWNLAVFAFLMLFRKKTRFKGELFLWYLSLYGIGRFFIEGLRTDQLRIMNFAVSQVLGIALFIISLFTILIKRMKYEKVGK